MALGHRVPRGMASVSGTAGPDFSLTQFRENPSAFILHTEVASENHERSLAAREKSPENNEKHIFENQARTCDSVYFSARAVGAGRGDKPARGSSIRHRLSANHGDGTRKTRREAREGPRLGRRHR